MVADAEPQSTGHHGGIRGSSCHEYPQITSPTLNCRMSAMTAAVGEDEVEVSIRYRLRGTLSA